jgi:enoyl-CoA hydratase/carnithine racemase
MATSSAAAPSVIAVTPPTPNGCTTRVVLNRPAKLNALNLEMIRALVPVLRTLKPNSCLLLEGAGDRAFCAGGDVASIREEAVKGNLGGLPADFFFEEYHIDYWLSKLKTDLGVTQVSIWNGVCMGGGVGISVHGVFRVATEKTLFAMPEVGIGLFPDVGATYALPRIKAGKEVGLYLAVTGARLGAKDCLWSGLATHYVPSNRLDVLRANLNSLGSSCDYKSVSRAIEAARNGAEPPAGKGAPLLENAEAIRECFTHGTAEEVVERLTKTSKGTSKHVAWAEATLKAIMVASPLSVKVSMEALKQNGEGSVSLEHAFMVEYRMAQRAMLQQPYSDFLEGVRAVLVDKDTPKWSHKSLEDVDMKHDVEPFFAPLGAKHPRGEFFGDIRAVLLKE